MEKSLIAVASIPVCTTIRLNSAIFSAAVGLPVAVIDIPKITVTVSFVVGAIVGGRIGTNGTLLGICEGVTLVGSTDGLGDGV